MNMAWGFARLPGTKGETNDSGGSNFTKGLIRLFESTELIFFC